MVIVLAVCLVLFFILGNRGFVVSVFLFTSFV